MSDTTERKALALACTVALLPLAALWPASSGFVPMWDGWVYGDCVLKAAEGQF